jgi:NAD-dependent dihydropyrimidine dehydrogenase PreA subunit
MAIERIDVEICIGCGICVDSCCMDVIRMDDEREKAIIRYPDDCILCHFCELDCPVDAISVNPDKIEPLVLSWG